MARARIVAEPDARQEQPEVALAHERADVGPDVHHPLERATHARLRVAHEVVRRRRHQHEPRDAFVDHIGVTHRERLHRHAAHRVTDQHHVAEVERLEHRAQVVGEVVERMAGLAHAATRRARGESNAMARNPAAGNDANCFAHTRDDSVTPWQNTTTGPSPRQMV